MVRRSDIWAAISALLFYIAAIWCLLGGKRARELIFYFEAQQRTDIRIYYFLGAPLFSDWHYLVFDVDGDLTLVVRLICRCLPGGDPFASRHASGEDALPAP